MKNSRRKPASVTMPASGCHRDVEREIETFLRALNSYPDRFAREPYLSFQQHLFSLAIAPQSALEER